MVRYDTATKFYGHGFPNFLGFCANQSTRAQRCAAGSAVITEMKCPHNWKWLQKEKKLHFLNFFSYHFENARVGIIFKRFHYSYWDRNARLAPATEVGEVQFNWMAWI